MKNLKKTLAKCYEQQELLLAACLAEEEISENVSQHELDAFRAEFGDVEGWLVDSHLEGRSIREGSLDALLLNGNGFTDSEEFNYEN